MKKIVASMVFSLAACSSAHDPQGASASDIECKGIATCTSALADLRQADGVLESEFDGAIARIRACEPRNSTKCYNSDRALELVRAEQQSWLAWRDAHCDVFAFTMEGTSAEGELEAFCRTGLAKERTLELQKIMSSEPRLAQRSNP